MFQGLHNGLMDDKGRLAFPAPLRAGLEKLAGAGDRFVLTQHLYVPCLVALTEAEFQAQADKVRALPPSNPAVMDFKRFFIAPAITLVVDKAGRVSVPKELRDFAGLEREVIWAGVLDRMELWSKTRWDDTNARRLQSAEEREKTRQELERYGL